MEHCVNCLHVLWRALLDVFAIFCNTISMLRFSAYESNLHNFPIRRWIMSLSHAPASNGLGSNRRQPFGEHDKRVARRRTSPTGQVYPCQLTS